MFNSTGSLFTPVWTLKAQVVAIDRNGQPVQGNWVFEGMTVKFNPEIHSVSGNRVTLRIPAPKDEWPYVVFDIPNHGGRALDLVEVQDDIEFDDFNKTATLHIPVPITEMTPTGFGVGRKTPDE